ncbi:hypothetical protein VR010_04035 [Actinomycetaceae bacterium L2_0104]
MTDSSNTNAHQPHPVTSDSSGPDDQPRSKPKRQVAPLLAAFFAGVLVTIGGFAIGNSLSGPNRDAAMEDVRGAIAACDLTEKIHPVETSASFTTFTDRTARELGGDVLIYSDMQCVFSELDMPHSVSDLIIKSKTIDGRMKETWGPYQVQWTRQENGGVAGQLSVPE